ncbi:DUF6879 family protein [Streptacidiphilus sp. P02-A3a]|uniref:DUF6879 family protein n=1 Tax=Streptacidiphilus sp. P02-A3a TaxID=2704468 RepID=UPI0015F94139|nr:DUF6879 family protein [Streptacidiphilus sp. P02-A3a]QMU71345.1 hypothetical protein GXP74_27055 [Streptacidiphilus sp. P02-A3a]
MRELFDRAQGVRLDRAAYVSDFDERFWRIGAEGFWKLECLQNYQETGFPSWEAFRGGDWAGALRLIDELRPEFARYYGQVRAAGIGLHRVRVVERPVSPYLQWELHVLRARGAFGEDSVVVTADRAATAVGPEPLPDLVVLGTEAVYEIHYTSDGTPDGATRFTAPAAVDRARSLVQRLGQDGERLDAYFVREIAGLGAPSW